MRCFFIGIVSLFIFSFATNDVLANKSDNLKAGTLDTTVLDASVLDASILDASILDSGILASTLDAGNLDIVKEKTTKPVSNLAADRLPTLELIVEPKTAAIGDLVIWKAKVKRRVGDRVILSHEQSFGGLDIKSRDSKVGKPIDDWVTETIEVKLISFEIGDFLIPSQDLTVIDIQGNIGNVKTEESNITIKSLIANEPEPQLKPDLKPGAELWEDDYTLVYSLAVLASIIAVILLTLLVRKLLSLRKPKSALPPPPPRPAEIIALEKLNSLNSSTYLNEGRHKLYHIVLSEAFREYIGNRYGFYSLERSTEELIVELNKQSLDNALFSDFLNLLNETDLVKFAKYIPMLDESNKMLNEAFRLVHITTPKTTKAKTGDTKTGDTKTGDTKTGDDDE